MSCRKKDCKDKNQCKKHINCPLKPCELQRVFNFETCKAENPIPLRGGLGIIITGATSNPGIGISFAKQYAQAGVDAGVPNYIVLTGRRGPLSCNDQLTANVAEINSIAPGTTIGLALDLIEAPNAKFLIDQSNAFFASHNVVLNILFLLPIVVDVGVIGEGTYDIEVMESALKSDYLTTYNTIHYARPTLYNNSLNSQTTGEVTVFYANSVAAVSQFFAVPVYGSIKAAFNNLMKVFKFQNPQVHICQMFNGPTVTEGFCRLLSPKIQDPINPGSCFINGNSPGLMRFCPLLILADPVLDMTPDEVTALYAQAIERFEEKTYQNLLDKVADEAESISATFKNYGLFVPELILIIGKQKISELTLLVQAKLNDPKNGKCYRKYLLKKIKNPQTQIQEMASLVLCADKCNALGILGFEEELNKINPSALTDAYAVVDDYRFLFANNIFGGVFYNFPTIEDKNGFVPACECPDCPNIGVCEPFAPCIPVHQNARDVKVKPRDIKTRDGENRRRLNIKKE